MRLFAAIVPPDPVRKELHALVTSVTPGTTELDILPMEDLLVPVSHFGSVTLRDFDQMLTALREDAESWPVPEVFLAGSAALEFEGDRSVWSRVQGDVEGLLTIGRGVPRAVKRLGFLVDRRKFRPWLPVGTITDTTTAPYLERLAAALDDYSSEPWQVRTLTILRRNAADETGQPDDTVVEEVSVGGRRSH